MRVSLIITTYNWKEALSLVLASALRQTRLPDEIIVADDGSADGTGEMVARLAREAPIPIIHSWQEDKGFRAAMSRNRAIAKASGEYLILVDGDIIMERHFIEDHLAAAQRGFFVQGSRVLLSQRKTEEILSPGGNGGISLFDTELANRKNALRFRWLSFFFSREGQGIQGVRACNLAFFKADALAINGFNEDFRGWGREDSDFACRLMHRGVRRYNLRFAAVAYHLHHPALMRERLPENDSLLQRTQAEKSTWCANGLANHMENMPAPAGRGDVPDARNERTTRQVAAG
ncbi:MAG: glycosyltransferase family 2 protein [Thermodesulfobacteriota bacterium]